VAHGFENMALMLQDNRVWVRTRYVGHCRAPFPARARRGPAARTRHPTRPHSVPPQAGVPTGGKEWDQRVASVPVALPPQPLGAPVAGGAAALRMVAAMSK